MINWKKILQSFFDILLDKLWEDKLDIEKDKDKLQLLINNWIKDWHPRFTEELYEPIKEEFIKSNKVNKLILEREFWMLWLNYSPKYTIKWNM